MDAEDHPVIRAMRRSKTLQDKFIDDIAAQGRSYEGRSLPKGTREWKVGQCLEASKHLLEENGWRQIRGWCLEPHAVVGSDVPFYHEWNTIDGRTAIDATLTAERCFYWGVPMRNDWRQDRTMLGFEPDPVQAMTAELRNMKHHAVGSPVRHLRGLQPFRMF